MKTSVSTISSLSAGALSNARDAARPPDQRAGLESSSPMDQAADQLRLDLDSLNAMFEKESPQSIIRWAHAQFGEDLAMTSSFGDQAVVLIHLAVQVNPRIRIIFIDTGFLFPETFAFMEQLRRRFDLNVWSYRTTNDPIQFLQKAGESDFTQRRDVAACCAANKNAPMERAMRDLGPRAWLRGIRRQQAETRKNAKFIDWSPRYGAYAISPLLNWSSKDVGLYMKQHELPYHPLVEQGYLSIGCNPLTCTRPVQIGEDARSGRWSGTGKLECGINSLDSAGL
jgi:phosphoadenosine phosphosulfate reductase